MVRARFLFAGIEHLVDTFGQRRGFERIDITLHACVERFERLKSGNIQRDHQMSCAAAIHRVVRTVHVFEKAAARQHARQHVDHRADGITLVLGHRQNETLQAFDGIGRRTAARIDGTAERNRFVTLLRQENLAARHARIRDTMTIGA